MTLRREEALAAREAEEGEDQEKQRHEHGAGALDGVDPGPEARPFLGAGGARRRAVG